MHDASLVHANGNGMSNYGSSMPPVECGNENIVCPGGMGSIGCIMPDLCMPVTENCPAFSRACPEMPPVECRPTSIVFSGGMDSIGCMMPDLCMPMETECPAMAPAYPETPSVECGPQKSCVLRSYGL